MKCYQANSGTGLSGLVLREIEEPHAGYRQVLVRVRANSLNFRELSILRGTYPLPVKADVVMCSDGVGEVIALGEGVSRAKVGDRVAAAMFPRWIDGPIAWEYAAQIGGSLDGKVGWSMCSRTRSSRLCISTVKPVCRSTTPLPEKSMSTFRIKIFSR